MSRPVCWHCLPGLGHGVLHLLSTEHTRQPPPACCAPGGVASLWASSPRSEASGPRRTVGKSRTCGRCSAPAPAHRAVLPPADENKPIWMHAEEREECKVGARCPEGFPGGGGEGASGGPLTCRTCSHSGEAEGRAVVRRVRRLVQSLQSRQVRLSPDTRPAGDAARAVLGSLS